MPVFFLVSLCASIVGAICGIGGGVIIKPVLDMLHLETVAAISFLSGCTVLSMSCYSVGRAMLAGEKRVSLSTGTPLAIGAAAGGLLGSRLFAAVKAMFAQPDAVGAVQAGCLAAVTLGTLVYTVWKERFPSYHVENKLVCAAIGLALGLMSSFLGIGGGPINLVVLYFFFSMDTKTAAANSLYIIFFSQLTNLIATIAGGAVPEFRPIVLLLMAAGGVGGGIIGRTLNKRIDGRTVEKLFIALMAVIILISIWNCIRYAGV
ncbi:MAG: sulfite exporter TauE/SafE family protein [Oscillospiraceae bacterium]|nr:sulfite exporter TauE/SafE family protein [Oscillospiraceae bacterium]